MMMRKEYMWAGLAAVCLAAVIGLWLLLSPVWALTLLKDKVSRSLGRELEVAGGVHLEFSPELAVRLDRVSLAGATVMDDDFITASSLRVPLTLSGLFGRSIDLSEVTLRDAQIGLVIDEMGRASWPAKPSPEPQAVKLLIENGAVRFFDRRTAQAFAFNEANMAVTISPTGELTVDGTATINRQHAKLQAYVKDIARVSATGSPAELSLEAPTLSANFNGRLATADGLGLAGTVTLSGPDLRQALRWAGGAPGGTLGFKAFTLTGGLDATGRAFGVEGADLTVDGMGGTGDLTLDFRGETPKLQAVIATDTINLDKYIPAAGGAAGDWGTSPLGFSALRGLDGAVTLNVKNLIYSG
ncbi:MAG: AsmA family protein, partial [Rhizobiales bacterium]|nr:AsmA family protein [Hyphomicrobiales bacterium]